MKKRMIPIAVAALALVALLILAASGCSSASNGTSGKITPTWTTAQIQGDVVSIPVNEIDQGKMVHFRVEQQGASRAFMAYRLDEEIYVRAAVCPPCRSESFSLAGDTLVCNACGTKFEASTGDGVSGACRNYPKAEVSYTVDGEGITLSMNDLVAAYENTVIAGRP